MNMAWKKADDRAAMAAGSGNWKEAERHFEKAVRLSKTMDPFVHFGSMCDLAISLKKLNKLTEYDRARAEIFKLALELSGPALAKICNVFSDPDSTVFYEQSLELAKDGAKVVIDKKIAFDRTG